MATSNGFSGKKSTKGIYVVDGHERSDVVEARKDFLVQMTEVGFLNRSNAPGEEQAALLPSIASSPDLDHTIVFFHDEST